MASVADEFLGDRHQRALLKHTQNEVVILGENERLVEAADTHARLTRHEERDNARRGDATVDHSLALHALRIPPRSEGASARVDVVAAAEGAHGLGSHSQCGDLCL